MDYPRRKRISFDQEGEVHEYTFSTYRKHAFLLDDEVKRIFLKNLARAREKHGFLVWAYVLMPDHIHLLIPARKALTADILSSIKQPFTKRIVAKLKKDNPDLLAKMVSGAKRGNSPYSFWQPRGGFYRNVKGPEEYLGCIEYIHMNPVRKGFVGDPLDWPWSSARNYKQPPPYEFEVDICDEWLP